MARQRVVVTGLGCVTPVGNDVASTWEALVAGKSGAAEITLFDASAFAVRFACEVKGYDPEQFLPKKKRKELDRFSELAIGAASMAIADAGLVLTEREETRAGCFLGVGLGGLATLEASKATLDAKGPSRLSPYTIPRVIGNLAAGHVSIAHRLRGPSYATASACATGAHAIGEAAEWIRRGRADVMVAGGTESTITPVGIGGFQAMHALSRRNDAPKRASRPFDRGRDGFVCGEGSGVLVLESYERAKARGARIYAELTGYGASSDAYHITSPAPDGDGCARSMAMALEDAEIGAEAIGYLNAHATSTGLGDKAECDGILRIFGDRRFPISATKSMTGHLLGAAGAVEAIITVLALRERIAPPTINVEEQDPDVPLDIVPNEARALVAKHALTNGFGFGGTNASLVFSTL